MQAHFTNVAGCKSVVKTAFVQLKLQENRYSVQSKLLTIQVIPHYYPPKETIQSRSAQILRKTIAKHSVAAETNSLSTTNEKRTIQAQRNRLKCEQSKPEHKAPKRYIEVGISDLHRIQADYIPVNRGSQCAPPQRTPRVDEVESRGWGRRAPQSPSSSSFGAPQGNNKIYTYDVVFSPGETRINNQSQTQFPYKKHRKSAHAV